MQSALAGFGFIDCFELSNPDRLHGGPKGLLERIVRYAKDALRAADVRPPRQPAGTAYATVSQMLKTAPGFPGLRLPGQGLDWPMITATEMAAVARMMLIPLSGAPCNDNGTLPDLVDLLQGTLDSPACTQGTAIGVLLALPGKSELAMLQAS